MYNPFKKEDKGFNLDNIKLPSLNEMEDSNKSFFTNTNENKPIMQSVSNNNENIQTNPSFSNPFSMQNNLEQQPNMSKNPFEQPQKQDLSSELIKGKIELIENKIEIIQTNMISLNAKMDMIYNMLLCEVSEETKQKLNLNNIKRNF